MPSGSTGTMTRPENVLRVRTSADLTSFRSSLETFLFAGTKPSEIGTLASETSPVAGLTSLSTTQKITMAGYSAVPILWTPTSANGDVMILHQGHSWTYNQGNYNLVLQSLLTAGYAVCGMVMPGGANTNTSGSSTQHNTDQSSLGTFVGPVVVAVNTLADAGYSNIFMSGLSGGAWTTHMAAAVDTRIDRSYPIAGSLPEYLPITISGTGARDWEQQLRSRGCPCDYLDLYVLGSCGSGRRQKQILHTTDACCFSQDAYNSGRPYATVIANVAAALGGDFDLVWKSQTTHEWNSTIFSDEVIADLP